MNNANSNDSKKAADKKTAGSNSAEKSTSKTAGKTVKKSPAKK